MKKMIMALAAVFMISTSAMAQDENKAERKQMTTEQMAQRRTDDMVKRYSLNEEQSAKLLELNKKYADMRPMGPRGGRRHQGMRSAEDRVKPQAADSLKRKEVKGMQARGDFEAMKKKMEEYDAQLKTILTEQQYAAYQADKEKMMKRGPQRRGNQHRNFDNK
ncbi:MAG: DUF4890 domain-containing protein [Prevotella sp.]|nr:DUF4890 domain-containing protein [Prevotella sp.]MBP3842305.1 DUF4890 domain-containing protein [Prevotella sp.]